MVTQIRVLFPELFDGPGQDPDLVGLGQAQTDIPAGDVVKGHEFPGDLVRHADQVLRPATQQHALVRQGDRKAVAREQLFAQLVLQCFERFGQRGLGHVQLLRRTGHVLLPGDGEKIAQVPDLHGALHEMPVWNITIFIITISVTDRKML